MRKARPVSDTASSLSAVAQKSNENQPRQDADLAPDGPPKGSEFENAVTTEISAVLASAFGEHTATEPNDLHVTDAHLTAHISPAADDTLLPGVLLSDRYEIVDLVHSGGMSLVYKAVDHGRRRAGSREAYVAVKMMRPSIASEEEARLSLQREAAKAQIVSHPNVIDVFDLDDDNGRHFLVMEWLAGESVNAMLRRTRGERLDPGIAWPIIAGVAAAVRHAHQKNVVHADINPSNIFISADRRIKLLDFGVARYTNRSNHPEDDRFAWVTKPYASPEVLSGQTPVVEDDVFSLACVAYRLLAGKHPFGGRLSLVAKHQGRSVEPIPGLPDHEWQFLNKALAFARSDRPGSVSDFVIHGATYRERDKAADRRKIGPLLQVALTAIIAIAISAGGLWFWQRDREAQPSAEPPVVQAPEPTGPAAAPAVSVAEALLAAANQALGAGRLISPDDGNARTLFREALVLEPDNVEALRGLRTISNDFVQQAHLALNADDPLQAYAALSIAAETDAANPAIEIVDQLLAAKARGELADARLAVANGEFDLAEGRLARAEQYAGIDNAEVQAIRQQIDRGRQGAQLQDYLRVADGHISAGRLLAPVGDNAQQLLLNLRRLHGDDPRLLATMERLGERLLTRAAFAAAAARVAEATELLDAVSALGVLTPEVDAARRSLETIDTAAVSAQVPEAAAPPAQERAQLPPISGGPAELASGADGAAGQQVADVLPAQELVAASVAEQAAPRDTVPQAPGAGAGSEARRRSLQELGIREYIPPRFPKFAERRGVSGMVEVEFVINPDGSTDAVQIIESTPGRVFAKSAAEAVRQWRFEPRDEALQAQVTLRFNFEE